MVARIVDIFLIGSSCCNIIFASHQCLNITQYSFIITGVHVCLWEFAWLLLCARACASAQSSRAMRTIFVSVGERERKAKYPGVCSHGYYHDVGGAGLLSPSCASLSHSLKVALADESLHSMLLARTPQPTHPASQSVSQSDRDRDVSHCISTLGGSGLCGWGLHVLIVSDCR